MTLVLFNLGLFGQEPANHGGAPVSNSFFRWQAPAVAVEALGSSAFSRLSAYAQFGQLRLTGATVRSEGYGFNQVTTGYVFAPLKREDTEFFVEPFVGSAFTREGSRLAVGGRFIYLSRSWFMENWTTKYSGHNGWTNCEPLADVMRHVGKGFYVGAASSCYIGTEHHEEKVERHAHFFAGPGMLYRRGKLDVGASYEFQLRGHQKFWAMFGTYTF